MLKKMLQFALLLLFLTSCAERGFKLTVNETTNTITAIKSVDIRKHKKIDMAKDIDIMSKAIKKAQSKHSRNKAAEIISTHEAQKRNMTLRKEKEERIQAKKERAKLEAKLAEEERAELEEKLKKEAEKAKEERMRAEEERAELEAKLRDEAKKAKKARIKAEKERDELEAKLKAEALEAIEAKKRRAQAEKERAELEAKFKKEERDRKIAAKKARLLLVEKEKAQRIAQAKKEKALQKIKKEKDRKALLAKLAIEKAEKKKKDAEEKLKLEQKIAKTKALQKKKEERERKALSKKLTTKNSSLEKKRKLALERKIAKLKALQKKKERRRNLLAQKEKALAKKQKANQLKQKMIAKKLQAQNLQKQKILVAKNIKKIKTSKKFEKLNFKPSTQAYQQFGTSEIHGHVVYLDSKGQEIRLKNTKVYLAHKNAVTDRWYRRYNSKSKESLSISKTTVQYSNATHLNIEKNFAFYGLPKGTYYIIIESDTTGNVDSGKVYIAKKITVQKYKKIMTVFSKKL